MRFPRQVMAGLAVLVGTQTAASETITYSYDAKGRLVKVMHTGTVNDGKVVEYTHDPADNRTRVKSTGP